jgi:hypothetical protein
MVAILRAVVIARVTASIGRNTARRRPARRGLSFAMSKFAPPRHGNTSPSTKRKLTLLEGIMRKFYRVALTLMLAIAARCYFGGRQPRQQQD